MRERQKADVLKDLWGWSAVYFTCFTQSWSSCVWFVQPVKPVMPWLFSAMMINVIISTQYVKWYYDNTARNCVAYKSSVDTEPPSPCRPWRWTCSKHRSCRSGFTPLQVTVLHCETRHSAIRTWTGSDIIDSGGLSSVKNNVWPITQYCMSFKCGGVKVTQKRINYKVQY